jgi:hypothetical protein
MKLSKRNIVLFLLLLFSIINSSCSVKEDLFPEKIGQIKLNKLISGEDALRLVNQMHLQNVTSEETKIGFYSSGKGKAIIYVTDYKNYADAETGADQMIQKINTSKTPFIRGKLITVENKKIFRTFGMGMTHFIFTDENNLIWISVSTHLGKDFLKAYLGLIM